MKKQPVMVQMDCRIVPAGYDEEIATWLGDALLSWPDAGGPVVRDGDGRHVTTTEGWELMRWKDGSLIVVSPGAAARLYEWVPPDEAAPE